MSVEPYIISKSNKLWKKDCMEHMERQSGRKFCSSIELTEFYIIFLLEQPKIINVKLYGSTK
jgi:hypothetical protein